LLSLRQDSPGYFQELQRTYGNMATIYFGRNPAVLLFRPEHVRYVLVENPRKFSNRGFLREDEGSANEGLLTIDGEKHRQQRRAVQPAFHKKQVEGYATTIDEYTQEMLKTWQMGDQVDLSRAMQELTLRIVSKCLFSIDLSRQLQVLSGVFNDMIGSPGTIVEDVLNIRIDNPITGYGRRMAATRQLDMLIYTMIAQRRNDEDEYNDVLSMLMSAPSGGEPATKLTDKQIHDHIVTFLAAGHETTANALVWTFYLLSQYPDVRKKLQEELGTVLGGRKPSLGDLPKLSYLDWVLSESMRLYPPAWMQARFVAQECEIDGVRLPVGTFVIMSQWVIHRLPEIWGDPEVFRPERWDPANDQQIPPGAYFPFGGGPRICIGMPFAQMEAKLILANMLQNYYLQPIPGYTPGRQALITLRPKRKLQVTLSPVNSTSTGSWAKVANRPVANGVERQGCLNTILGMLGLTSLLK
jgi:cytochrome P450